MINQVKAANPATAGCVTKIKPKAEATPQETTKNPFETSPKCISEEEIIKRMQEMLFYVI